MANYIPLDIVVNHIFIRLPVKSLLSCKCVCKLWLQIISGLDLKRIHAQHQVKHDHRHQNVLCGPLKYRFSYYWYNYEIKNPEFRNKVSACRGIFYSLDLESTPPKLNRLPGFPEHRMNNFKLMKTLGYINGMLCMEARNIYDRRWPHIFFGNPSTGCYMVLPDPLVDGPLIVGFGYDSSNDDYKFVRIDNVTRHPHIYSLKSNSWTINVQSRSDKHKSVLENSVLRDYVSEGCFVDGSIYWYVNASIVRFNLKDEKLTELDMPRGNFGHRSILLKAVQDSLCIINRYWSPPRRDIGVDMWLLKSEEEKKENTIEKKYYFTKLLNLSSLSAESIYPLSFMKDGKVVCCVEYEHESRDASPPKNRYVVIDPHTSSIQNFNISGINGGILQEFIFRSHYSGYIDSFLP